MRISEESVIQQYPFTNHGAAIPLKMAEQAEIDRLRAEFLKRGGKIKVADPVKAAPKMFDGYKSVDEKRKAARAALKR